MSQAKITISKCWSDSSLEHTKPVHDDLKYLFEKLKEEGISIAVVTSANRTETVNTMVKLE